MLEQEIIKSSREVIQAANIYMQGGDEKSLAIALINLQKALTALDKRVQ
jgi:hypothetical protein